MFRVIYRWSVEPENVEQFERVWLKATNTIYKNVKGAMGSLLMRSANDENIMIGVARWRSLEEWEAFWNDSNPIQMESLSDYSKRISIEKFEEINDQTVSE